MMERRGWELGEKMETGGWELGEKRMGLAKKGVKTRRKWSEIRTRKGVRTGREGGGNWESLSDT